MEEAPKQDYFTQHQQSIMDLFNQPSQDEEKQPIEKSLEVQKKEIKKL